jgi:hypothetical protein
MEQFFDFTFSPLMVVLGALGVVPAPLDAHARAAARSLATSSLSATNHYHRDALALLLASQRGGGGDAAAPSSARKGARARGCLAKADGAS